MALHAPVLARTHADARARPRQIASWLGLRLALAVFAILWVAPVVWMFSTALKPEGEVLKYPPEWLPRRVTLENFQVVTDNFPIFRWYLNDLITACCATVLVLITGSLAGYGFARIPFRFKEVVFYSLMLALLVPPEVTFIPLFLGFSNVGLGNTYPALFLPLVANAFALFLFRDFFEQLPLELEDAARVDGASRWQVYLRIVLPLSTPVLVAVAILTFMTSWNNFMWPLIIAGTDETKTLPVGMNQFAPAGGMSSVGYGLTMAGTTIVAVPAILVFLLLSRQFMRGVSFTGLKG
jgi:ABC-type glycerol-3-phosphate transport system permease component